MNKAPNSGGTNPYREPSISRAMPYIATGAESNREEVSPSSVIGGFADSYAPQQPIRTNHPESHVHEYGSTRYGAARYDVPDVEEEAINVTGDHRLVIAIDYGTTFTGIGYATPDSGNAGLTSIRVLSNWGSTMTNDVKIPSVISYSPRTVNQEQQFGADLSPEAVAFVNTKLELDVQDTRLEELDLIVQVLDGMKNLNFHNIKAMKGLPAYTWKQPEDIVMDYLRKAFACFMKATEYMAEIRKTAPVDVIVTVPVSWSYRARNSTLKAIRGAGFNETNFGRLPRYVMVAEPEAAAIYTARYLQEQGAKGLKLGECFILCDAGGGTVDVVGYKVKKLTPSLELEEITIPTGAKCGASFINADFKRWLLRVLGETNYNQLDPRTDGQRISSNATEGGAMRDLMKAFEVHKKAFHQESAAMHIDLPAPLQSLSIPNMVVEGDLTITNQNMRSLFHKHVDTVIELIQSQIAQVEDKRNRVGTILLIGGFGESQYLQEELEHSMGLRDVRLRRPETSWSAVVRGATLYGIELAKRQDQKVMIPCPRNIGIKMNDYFTRKRHNPRDTFTNELSNQIMAGDQLVWLIQKGDLLLASDDREIEKELGGQFRKEGRRVFILPLFEYLDDNAPTRFKIAHEEVKQIAQLTANFEGYPIERFERLVNQNTGTVYYQVSFTCKLKVKGMRVVAELWWYDQRLDTVTINDIDKILTGQSFY